MSAELARAAGIETRSGRFPLAANGRAMTMEVEDGFVKILARADNHLILGMQAVADVVEAVVSLERRAGHDDRLLLRPQVTVDQLADVQRGHVQRQVIDFLAKVQPVDGIGVGVGCEGAQPGVDLFQIAGGGSGAVDQIFEIRQVVAAHSFERAGELAHRGADAFEELAQGRPLVLHTVEAHADADGFGDAQLGGVVALAVAGHVVA